jgi:general L-amino acid transport system permease protein
MVVSTTRRHSANALSRLVFNVRVLRILGQLTAIVVLVVVAAYISDNYQANTRGQSAGWDFLDQPTGFNIAFADFRSGQPVRDALWVGVKNTLACALVGMVLSTVIGVVVGVLRLSNSWLARKAATFYVELLRNVPVLLIILFVAASLRTLPRIEDEWSLGGILTVSNREIDLFGFSLNMPYVAITVALAAYHGSHIAEIVRGSIQAVPYGQTEAATAVGLSDFQRLRFVVLPQAFRIAVPPIINQHLSLTKNTSLGIAVAYSDVTSLGERLIGSSRAPALEMILILMAIYLIISLTTSLLLNLVNRRLRLVER